MKLSIAPLVLATVFAVGMSSANADMFGDLKSKLKAKSKREAVSAVAKSPSKSKSSSKAKGQAKAKKSAGKISLGSGPSSNLVSMTQCSDVKPSNIIVGNVSNYTFQQGFNKEKRSGFINRKPGKLSQGCILPSLQSHQSAYMEVDTKKFASLGSSNDWIMQCVRSANPSAGAVSDKEGRSESPYHVKFLTGKDMMLHCGNSEGIDECTAGSNSKRGSAWKKKLKKNGKTMLSVHANTSTLAPAGGEKLYCQYYNKKSYKSLFAFEFLRKR